MFDITVQAFHGLWKFDEDMDGSLPDPAEVQKRLALVGWKDIVVDHAKKTVFLRRKGMAITLGGIAKGYAVDKCVALVKAAGFTDFMVQAGGDMYVGGLEGRDAVGRRRFAIRARRTASPTCSRVAPIRTTRSRPAATTSAASSRTACATTTSWIRTPASRRARRAR